LAWPSRQLTVMRGEGEVGKGVGVGWG
jgi:hypothetical protein